MEGLRGAATRFGDRALRDREVKVALHPEAVRLHALELGERHVPPFVAIGALLFTTGVFVNVGALLRRLYAEPSDA